MEEGRVLGVFLVVSLVVPVKHLSESVVFAPWALLDTVASQENGLEGPHVGPSKRNDHRRLDRATDPKQSQVAFEDSLQEGPCCSSIGAPVTSLCVVGAQERPPALLLKELLVLAPPLLDAATDLQATACGLDPFVRLDPVPLAGPP